MTNKIIIWKGSDGTVRETYPCDAALPGESEQHYLDRVAMELLVSDQELLARGLTTRTYVRMPDVLPSTLPSDHFRDAWTHNGTAVVIDMVKARAIHQQRLLVQRDTKVMATAVAAFLGDVAAKTKLQGLTALEQTLPIQLAAITDSAVLAAFVPAILA